MFIREVLRGVPLIHGGNRLSSLPQEVLWFHNSEIVDVYLSGRFRSVQRSHPEQMCLNALHLINTTGDDQGTYECKIMGPSVSSHATRELLLAGENTLNTC